MPEGKENGPGPIELSASRIRASVSQFVTQELHGAFPRNHAYMYGDYDRVFVVVEGYGNQQNGFFIKGHLVTLDSDGKFRAGEVDQEVGECAHSWEFHNTELTLASDKEVIKYAPLLMVSLFGQIEKELKEESDPQKKEKWSDILQRREGEIFAVLVESRNALIEAGGNSTIPSSGAQDYGSLAMAGIEEILKKDQVGLNHLLSKYENILAKLVGVNHEPQKVHGRPIPPGRCCHLIRGESVEIKYK